MAGNPSGGRTEEKEAGVRHFRYLDIPFERRVLGGGPHEVGEAGDSPCRKGLHRARRDGTTAYQ